MRSLSRPLSRSASLALSLSLAFLGAVALAPTEALAKQPSLVKAGLLEARTHPDTHWFGEKAYMFRVDGITAAKELEGKRVTWTIDIKRKLANWKSAKSWLMGKQKVEDGTMNSITFAMIYRSLAKQKFQPGEHVARFIAKDADGRVVYEGTVGFVLPATGPNAYNPKDFR